MIVSFITTIETDPLVARIIHIISALTGCGAIALEIYFWRKRKKNG